MANLPGSLISPNDEGDFREMLQQWRRNRFRYATGSGSGAKQLGDEPDPVFPMVLLGNLAVRRPVQAEKLKFTRGYVLDVVVLGWPSQPVVDVPLTVNNVAVEVPSNATAEEFRTLTGTTGRVSLGSRLAFENGVRVQLNPARWRIEWSAEDDADEIIAGPASTNWFVRVEESAFVGTGRLVTVRQSIPTGFDTPLRAGAVIEAVRGQGGYRVLGAEARFWYGTPNSSPGGT